MAYQVLKRHKEEETVSPKIVAVITAAVCQSLGTPKYRIKHIRRTKRKKMSPWVRAARLEQMRSYMN